MMKKIIVFLKVFEENAFLLYKDCSQKFSNDTEYSHFLKLLSDDEALHFHFISSASEVLSTITHDVQSDVLLYENMIKRIDMPNMDEIQFYKETIEKRPEQKESFAFITGRIDYY